MTMQDAASGVALWRQVADGIERGIADGSFASGERLPGEMEIAEHRVFATPCAGRWRPGRTRPARRHAAALTQARLACPLRSRTGSRDRRRGRPPGAQPVDAASEEPAARTGEAA
jgi:GntR family phosphonate transport system transcriptional regulator